MTDKTTLPLPEIEDIEAAADGLDAAPELCAKEAEPSDDADLLAEETQARMLAERYHLEYVDMGQFQIDNDLFRSLPADLMLRYGFVPLRREDQALVVVVSDPTDLPMIDELSVLLGTPVKSDGRGAIGDPNHSEKE